MYLEFQTRQTNLDPTIFIIDSGIGKGHSGKLTVDFAHTSNYTRIRKSIPYDIVENMKELHKAVSHCLNLEFDRAAISIATVMVIRSPEFFSIDRIRRQRITEEVLTVNIDSDTKGTVFLRTLLNDL